VIGLLVLLSGCAWGPARVLADGEHADMFALESHGHAIGGTALVAHVGGTVTLHAIAPTGTDLFEVRVGPSGAEIRSPDEALAGWLDRVPFHRDLTALYRATCDTDRCRFEAFRIVRRETSWRISGPGGPATWTADPAGGWRLSDRRRGYTLRVVPAEVAP